MTQYHYIAENPCGTSSAATAHEAIQDCCLSTAGFVGMDHFWKNQWICYRIPGPLQADNKLTRDIASIEGAVIVHEYYPETEVPKTNLPTGNQP